MAYSLQRQEYYARRAERRRARIHKRLWIGAVAFAFVAGALAAQILLPLHVAPASADTLRIERSVFYRNCAAARAAGVAPIYEGQPGYRSGLDADGDGVACEPYPARF